MPTSRRGSGSVTLPTGQVLAIHHRTQDEEDLPHATKKCRSSRSLVADDVLIRYERPPEPWPITLGNTRACALKCTFAVHPGISSLTFFL